MKTTTTKPKRRSDKEIYNELKSSGRLERICQENMAYDLPGNKVLTFSEDGFMRKDKTQVLFYGRTFLDFFCHRITTEQAIILALMDGEHTIDDVSFLLQQHCGENKELCDFKVRRVLATVDACDPNYSKFEFSNDYNPAPNKKYNPTDFIISPDDAKFSVDLDKPVIMMWMPTSACQTNCVYCYATRRPISKSELLTDQRVKELFDEAADIGICSMNVDGGDALCRKNIEDLLAYAIERDIKIDLSTKVYISKDKAKRLHDAGITLMQVGFDAPTPELFDKTVGVKGHFYRTIESIHNCVDAGLTVRSNSILTQETYSHIHELVDLLHTLPLRDMKITVAFRSAYRHREGLMLNEDEKNWLRRQIVTLKEKYPQGKIKFECRSDFLEVSDEERKKQFLQYPRCAIGRESIIITPDGKVAMCEQSPHSKDLIVGDVKHNSIMDVWTSERMRKFKYVTREQYEGTVCYDCEDFENCFHVKGGCLILVIKAYGTRYAPYPLCPKAPKYKIPLQ